MRTRRAHLQQDATRYLHREKKTKTTGYETAYKALEQALMRVYDRLTEPHSAATPPDPRIRIFVIMAYRFMASIVVAYIVMACMAMAYIVMAHVVMACVVTDSRVLLLRRRGHKRGRGTYDGGDRPKHRRNTRRVRDCNILVMAY